MRAPKEDAKTAVNRYWSINELRVELAAVGDDGLVSLHDHTAEWLLEYLEATTPQGTKSEEEA